MGSGTRANDPIPPAGRTTDPGGPFTIDTRRFARACALPADDVEASYLAAALAGHPNVPPGVREDATELATRCFPLHTAWHRIFDDRGLRGALRPEHCRRAERRNRGHGSSAPGAAR